MYPTDTPKVCQHGNHPIRNGRWVKHFRVDAASVDTEVTYSCEEHDDERRIKEYRETGILTTRLSMVAALEAYRWGKRSAVGDTSWFEYFQAEMGRVTEAFKVWEREVWFGGETPELDPDRVRPYSERLTDILAYKCDATGRKLATKGSLQAFVLDAKWKGYRANVANTVYLSYTMCGRSIFQIDDSNGAMVTLILDEDSPTARGGIQGIQCTADKGVTLINKAVEDWKAGRITLVQNEGVGFGL